MDDVVAATYTSAELITIIGVLFTSLTALVGTIFAGIAAMRAAQVRNEVKTANGLTMAALADAGETRRIAEIAPADRTDGEDEHIAVIPPPDPVS